MKKILFILLFGLIFLEAGDETFKNGEVMEHKVVASYNEYTTKKESSGKIAMYECDGNILFSVGFRSRALSHNPHTGKPYFCEYERIILKQRGWVDSEKELNKITVRYRFEDINK